VAAEGDGGGAGGGTLIPVPVATTPVSASYAGCGSSRRSESLSRCRCLQRAVVTHVVVVGSCRGPPSDAPPDLGYWPAHKPFRQAASANTRPASATTTRGARWLLVVCGMWAAGMWHAGCGLLHEVVRLFF
jgi:hypothetical protein